MGRQEKELPKWLTHINKTKKKMSRALTLLYIYIFSNLKRVW